jgi:hypothetical protein
MRGRFHQAGIRLLGCLAVLAAAGSGGLGVGYMVKPGLAPEPGAVVVADLSPTEAINLRFPADWTDAETAPRTLAFASADGTFTLFSPRPIYAMAQPKPAVEAPAPAPVAAAVEPPAPVAAAAGLPAEPKAVAAAPARMALASTTPSPKPKPVRSNAVLSEAQIAGIKRRLNLTPEQERYWPAVAAELRKMEYRKDRAARGTQVAAVDMSRVDVDGLKSAGFPLVMSFNDDQRRELRSLAHLLGLEKVMAGI